jgi:hypothetical protein
MVADQVGPTLGKFPALGVQKDEASAWFGIGNARVKTPKISKNFRQLPVQQKQHQQPKQKVSEKMPRNWVKSSRNFPCTTGSSNSFSVSKSTRITTKTAKLIKLICTKKRNIFSTNPTTYNGNHSDCAAPILRFARLLLLEH